MKITFVDTILENHVPDSLIRGLRRLGHRVETTGKIWHGAEFPTAKADVKRLRSVVDGIIADRPDAVFVMRACALLPRELKRLRKSGIKTVVWFSDDPVFYETQGRSVAAQYDVSLNTATARILTKYQEELGVLGFGFQFWTSQEAFARQYDPATCTHDVVFIGNAHTKVRLWRYDWLAQLPLSRVMFGLTQGDPDNIVAGVLNDDADLAEACAVGRFGLSVGQRFEDYQGTPFDFPGLAELGEFPLPSRIVQFASVGAPVVHMVKYGEAERDLSRLFPPVKIARSDEDLVRIVTEHRNSPEALARLSDDTFNWFRSHYSGDARASFVHDLLMYPDRFRGLSAEERAFEFLNHPPRDGWRRWRTFMAVRLADALTFVLRGSKHVARKLLRVVLPAKKRASGARESGTVA